MRRNVASQLISAQMVSATDGSDVTGGTTAVAVEIDGVAGTGGNATHIANGKWEYAPIQADTDGAYLTFQFTQAGAITQTVQVYTIDAISTDVWAEGTRTLTAATNITSTDGQIPITAGGFVNADIAAISTDTAAATNLEADYDGTGYAKANSTIGTTTTNTDMVAAAPTAAANAAAVWDEDATGHQTQGTFGQAIGDPVDDTTTIYQAVATDAAGDNVSIDVAAVKAETALIVADTNELQTDDVPGLIAALNNITAADVWAAATRTLTAGTNLNDISVADILTTQMTESYAANGTAPTLAQAQFAMHQMLMQFGISGTSITVRQLDNSTTAFVVTLDDGTDPTDAARV